MPLASFYVGHPHKMQATPKEYFVSPVRILEKLNSHLQVVYQLRELLGQDEACVYFSLQPQIPIGCRPVQAPLCLLPWPLEFIPVLFRRPCFFGVLYLPWAYSYCLLFHRFFLRPQRKDLMATSCLGLSVLRSLTLYSVWLWLSVFVPICCRRKLLRGWLSVTDHATRSHLLLRCFSRLIIGFYPQVLGLSSFRLWDSQAAWLWIPSPGVDIKSRVIVWFLLPTLCHHYVSVLCRQDTTVN